MKLSLTGWQRLGILLSVFWAIGVLLFTVQGLLSVRANLANPYPEHQKFKDSYFVGYFEIQLKEMLPARTVSRVLRENPYLSVSFEPGIKVFNVSFLILAPVLVGWVFIYGLLFAVTWVRQGFDRSST
jgi:hypothetical protein